MEPMNKEVIKSSNRSKRLDVQVSCRVSVENSNILEGITAKLEAPRSDVLREIFDRGLTSLANELEQKKITI